MGLFDRFKRKNNAKETKSKVTEVPFSDSSEYFDEWEKRNRLLHIWVKNNQKGENLESQGKIDEAITVYEENIKLGADTPFTFSRLSSLYHYKKEFKKERNVLKKYLSQLNNYSQVAESKRLPYLKDFENVDSFLNTGKWKFDCLPSDPKPIYYDIKEAKTLLKSEDDADKQKGIDSLEKIMADGTYNNTVYNTLYQYYNKNKQFDDSIRVCEKAIEVLGLFSNDRKERWNINLDKAVKRKEKQR